MFGEKGIVLFSSFTVFPFAGGQKAISKRIENEIGKVSTD